jgi:hypothetical protein
MAELKHARKSGKDSKNNPASALVFRAHYEADDGMSHMTICMPQPLLPVELKADLDTVVALFWAGLNDEIEVRENLLDMYLRCISVYEVFGDPTDHDAKEQLIQEYLY